LKTLEDTASDRDSNLLASVGSDFTTPIKKGIRKGNWTHKNLWPFVTNKSELQKYQFLITF